MSPGKKNIKSFKVVAGHQGVGEFDNEQKSECFKMLKMSKSGY